MKAGQFIAEIEVDTSVSAPTEIHAYMNGEQEDVWYPNGWEVVAINKDGSNANALITSDESNNTIVINVQSDSMDNKIMRVCVTPKGVDFDCNGFKKTTTEPSFFQM